MEYMESMMQNQYDAQNQLIMELDGTRMERDQLKAERDALASSIAALHRLHSDLTNSDMVCDEDENHVGYVIENEQIDEMERLLNEPQQHLSEIRAEAGRKGFIDGFNESDCIHGSISTGDYDCLNREADQYAAKVRQGAE
jgi:hypothetical protein